MRLGSDHLNRLREREDFNAVLVLLESRGLISVKRTDGGDPFLLTLTGGGYSYFENSKDAIIERRWTRGLSIAAIIISLLALFLQFFDSRLFQSFKSLIHG